MESELKVKAARYVRRVSGIAHGEMRMAAGRGVIAHLFWYCLQGAPDSKEEGQSEGADRGPTKGPQSRYCMGASASMHVVPLSTVADMLCQLILLFCYMQERQGRQRRNGL